MLLINPFKAEFPRLLSRLAHQWHEDPPKPDAGVSIRSIPDPSMTIVTPPHPGLTMTQVEAVRSLLLDLQSGRGALTQYLVFELKGGGTGDAPAGLSDLLGEVSDLIVRQPIVTVAWARGSLSGSDLELAVACSILTAEPQARFSFDLDLVTSQRTYATLARKIGFVRAERLMEGGVELDTKQMEDLFLLKQVPASGNGLDGLSAFIGSRARRHNATCGIYRAQRLAITGP